MMPLFWVTLCSMLPCLAHFSGPDHCTIHEDSSLQNESPLLKSLQCHNDYQSFVHCEWREHRNPTLQLWFKTDNSREQCLPYVAAAQDASEHRTVQCRYKTRAFAIGIKHTVFFFKKATETLCSSVLQRPLDLSQHLRAQPPDNLSTRDTGDGGRLLSWSSPYPSSSSLNQNITFQLSYRTDGQDSWKTVDVRNTSMKLEKRLLLPGHKYDGRVRARVSVGHWSHWSPVVTWQMEEGAWQFPRLHCVLVGEKEVMCSWEISRELSHFITHQLACRHNHTAPSERCCVNPIVNSELSGTVLKYSCSLTVENPAHLLLELVPTRNAKIFQANQHIRPHPPEPVTVRKKGSNWMVEWTQPSTASKLRLYYQLCYYRIQDQKCSIQNISAGSMSLTILQTSLVPSQDYQVKVRALVVPEEDSIYRGIPSEWTDPVDWNSHEAAWSLNTLIYVSISVFVATVFCILYCTIPACQRRVILWVDSVPSPGKSKILSEIKSATSCTLVQSEYTSVCKVQHLDCVSTCSSDASLWTNKSSEKKPLEQDEGCWKCNNHLSLVEEGNSSGQSSMSFSGPYILCQASEPNCRSVGAKCDVKETLPDDSESSPPVNFALYGKGYVCLPNRSASRSTQDLFSHSEANTCTQRHDTADTTQWADKTEANAGLGEPISSCQPPASTPGPITGWPQGGTMQASGYCQLPTAHMRAEH